MTIQPVRLAFQRFGGFTLLAGAGITASLLPLIQLPALRGPQVVTFLAYYSLAGAAYALAVYLLPRERPSVKLIWTFAVLFRILLLFTGPPTLSDDVYRYIWDGHLLGRGINPYAAPVNDPTLDAYAIPARELVNNSWMASPYPPLAQLFFGLMVGLAPGNALAFQIGAVLFDLGTGWLVSLSLPLTGLPRRGVLLYLWNPLVMVEFAHGAHLDAVMLCLMMAGLYFALRAGRGNSRWGIRSALAFGGAVLSKLLGGLTAALFLRRWGLRGCVVFVSLIVSGYFLFSRGAGYGLSGPLDGRGVFGALRIFQAYWSYNGGLYHWLEVWWSGFTGPGAVPLEVIGPERRAVLRTAMSALLVGVTGLCAWAAWRMETTRSINSLGIIDLNRSLMRLAAVPLGAYLLLTHTLHPWYVTLILPLLPFFQPSSAGENSIWRWVWPWVYFSIAVAFSYLTYLDPANLREFPPVRIVEYLPFYALLLWAAWPAVKKRIISIN